MSHKVELVIYLNTDDESLKIADRWRAAGLTRKIADLVESVYVVDKIIVKDAPAYINPPAGWDKVETSTDEKLAKAIWGPEGFNAAPGVEGPRIRPRKKPKL